VTEIIKKILLRHCNAYNSVLNTLQHIDLNMNLINNYTKLTKI